MSQIYFLLAQLLADPSTKMAALASDWHQHLFALSGNVEWILKKHDRTRAKTKYSPVSCLSKKKYGSVGRGKKIVLFCFWWFFTQDIIGSQLIWYK